MNMLHKTFAGLLLSLILFSCKKGEQVDLSTLQTYHNVAIPLISAEIDVEDMLQSDTGDIISTGNNGELFLAYVTPKTTINAAIPDSPKEFNKPTRFVVTCEPKKATSGPNNISAKTETPIKRTPSSMNCLK